MNIKRPALARGRRRFDQQILLAALVIGALLHDAHAEFIGFGGSAGLGGAHGNGRKRKMGHEIALAFFGAGPLAALSLPPSDWVILV